MLSQQPLVPHFNTNKATPVSFSSNLQSKPVDTKILDPVPELKRKRALEELSDELVKLITEDISLFTKKGWKGLVDHLRPRDDFSSVNIAQLAHRLLKQFKYTGVPVITKDAP